MIVAFKSDLAAVDAVVVTAVAMAAIGVKPVVSAPSSASSQAVRLHRLARAFEVELAEAGDLRGCRGSLDAPILLAASRRGFAGDVPTGVLELASDVDLDPRRQARAGTSWYRLDTLRPLPVACPTVGRTTFDDHIVPDARSLAFAAQVLAAHALGPDMTHGRVSRFLADGDDRAQASEMLSRLALAFDETGDAPSGAGPLWRQPTRRAMRNRGDVTSVERRTVDDRSVRFA